MSYVILRWTCKDKDDVITSFQTRLQFLKELRCDDVQQRVEQVDIR